MAAHAFLIEPRWLEVSHVRIETERLGRPLRIAVVADLQTDAVGAHERRALESALASEPDLIVLPGDFLQIPARDKERMARERGRLRSLLDELGFQAPLGVYAVGGNTDSPGWESLFEGLPVTVFPRSGSVELDELSLTALDVTDSFRRDLVIPRGERFHLVLGHGPDYALGDRVEADLLIAGHCHGGQVRLPFLGPPIKLSRVPRRLTSGAHEIRSGTWLVVSRGVGMERAQAPRLRFLCRPEVVVIDLVPYSGAPADPLRSRAAVERE